MAWSYFMNMEKLSLMIANEHLKQMTNDNFIDDIFLDEEKLINNLKNGFVIITQLNCYIESFLNTIINTCIEYKGKDLYKCNVSVKMDVIFMYYQKDWTSIKEGRLWKIYDKTRKVRNEMMHYKKTYIGDGSGIPEFELGGEKVSQFFTKDNMEKLIFEHISLAKEIASKLGLKINHNVDVFRCDGVDQLVNYVYDDRLQNY